MFDEDVNRVNGSWGKYLLDLEDMAKDYESEHGNETLFKIARNAYGQTHDGDDALHSIPYQPSIFGFFYNKTLFTKDRNRIRTNYMGRIRCSLCKIKRSRNHTNYSR